MSRPNSLLLPASAVFSLGLLALGLACDREPAQSRTPAPAPESTAPEGAEAPSLGEAPKATVQTSGPYVTRGSQANKAMVQDLPEVMYQWTIEGGVITEGADSPSVVYTVDDAAATVRLYCRLRNAKGREFTAAALQTAVAPPVVEAFTSNPQVITAGSPANLAWTAHEIKSLTLDPGGIDATKIGSMPIQIKETTTYTLTAMNMAGASQSRQLTVKVVPPPEIKSFGAEGRILVGQPFGLKAEFINGKAEIRQGDTVLGSSEQSPLAVQMVATDNVTITLTVTNEGGVSVSQTRTFQRAGY